jgi:hypothetical protein
MAHRIGYRTVAVGLPRSCTQIRLSRGSLQSRSRFVLLRKTNPAIHRRAPPCKAGFITHSAENLTRAILLTSRVIFAARLTAKPEWPAYRPFLSFFFSLSLSLSLSLTKSLPLPVNSVSGWKKPPDGETARRLLHCNRATVIRRVASSSGRTSRSSRQRVSCCGL